jgi:hypothetical protein
VDDPGPEIPRLERLMRDVLRAVCEQTIGVGWLTDMSSAVASAIAKAGAMARTKRPGESLRDDWDAVGLDEIASLVRSRWQPLSASLAPAWHRVEEADVDIHRLLEYRGKALHAVGATNSATNQAETAAVITRLRLAFEEIRRSLLPDDQDWLPYLERIESPIPGLCWSRGERDPQPPTLRQGDRVEFRLIGVNPAGDQGDLRYSLEVTGVVAGAQISRSGEQ